MRDFWKMVFELKSVAVVCLEIDFSDTWKVFLIILICCQSDYLCSLNNSFFKSLNRVLCTDLWLLLLARLFSLQIACNFLHHLIQLLMPKLPELKREVM